jgi:hypothetical protein
MRVSQFLTIERVAPFLGIVKSTINPGGYHGNCTYPGLFVGIFALGRTDFVVSI